MDALPIELAGLGISILNCTKSPPGIIITPKIGSRQYINCFLKRQSAWIGKQAKAQFARIGWDTCTTLLALLTLLNLKVFLNTTSKVKCRKESRLSFVRRSVIFKVPSSSYIELVSLAVKILNLFYVGS